MTSNRNSVKESSSQSDMKQNLESAWSPRELARVLFRYQRRGLIVTVSVIAVVAIAVAVCPRKYTSEGRLFVRLGRESVSLDPTATTGQVIQLSNSRETEINSVIEVLRSRSNIERVLDAVGPETPISSPVDRERAVNRLLKDINIFSPKSSNVIVLTSEAGTPERAQKILEALIKVCLDEHIRVNRTRGSYEFFDEQTELLKRQLDAASEELRDTKSRYGLATLESRRNTLEQQLGTVRSQLRENQAALTASEARIENLQASLDGLPVPLVQQLTGGTPNAALSSMRQKLYELQTREQELLSRMTPSHPLVRAIRREVKEAERILDQELPNHDESSSAVLANEQANAASLRARTHSLEQQQGELEGEMRELNNQEFEVTQLERKVRLLDANYVHYVTSLEQARIDQALKSEGISNINVIQSPTYVAKPESPKKAVTLLMASFLACGAGLGTMFASQQLDNSLKTADEVEQRLQLPVLASIPHLDQSYSTVC